MLRVKTKSGTTYEIDTESHTWIRVPGNASAKTRTNSGTYTGLLIKECITLVCPPFSWDFPVPRVIVSTPIVEVRLLQRVAGNHDALMIQTLNSLSIEF